MPFVKDPVRAKDRAEVYQRDGGCIAPLVDRSAGPCRDGLGRVIDRTDPRGRTIDHVPRYPGSTRISSPRWMVWLCRGHHAYPSYWETAHRQEERDYLARKYGDLSMEVISFDISSEDIAAMANFADEVGGHFGVTREGRLLIADIKADELVASQPFDQFYLEKVDDKTVGFAF